MKLIAFDPGGTTGVCYVEDGIVKGHSQLKGPHYKELYNTLDIYWPDIVVCESFHYRNGLAKADLIPLEYIGVIKLWCEHAQVEYVEQSPSQGKAFWTNDKLKQLGLHRPGMVHANDATRHMLYYLCFTCKQQRYLNKLGGVVGGAS